MNIGKYRKVLAISAAAALMSIYGVAEAQAGWGSFGSRGGSWGGGSSGGSWGGGSSGGSWGSRGGGSSGGSWGSRGGGSFGGHRHGGLFARHRARKMARWGSNGGSSGGSWGGSSGGQSWGSSGGSRGYTYYSSSGGGSSGGFYRGYGSGGSSGGYVQSTPVYTQPSYSTPSYAPMQTYPSDGSLPIDGTVFPAEPTPAAPIDGGQTPTPGPERTNTVPDPVDGTDGNTDTALLNLEVPSEAVVYVNGQRTATPGSFRRFVSKNLKSGKDYTYEVKAEVERDGQTLTRTRVVQLTAGDNKTFEMDFDETRDLITSVTLFVPHDAKVSLGGVDTKASGPMRYFSTSKLGDGQSWDGYHVVVTLERDGKLIQRERKIDVNAGDSVNLRFDFDADAKVATR